MKVPLNPLSSLCRAYTFMLGIPSKWYYALLYFALIPLYAWIYVHLPGEFYHANVSREPMISQDEKHISQELEKEIINAFRSKFGDQTVVDEWNISAKDFKVLFLKATDKEGEVEIRFKLTVKLTDTSHQRSLFIDPVITFPAKGVIESRSGNDAGDESTMGRYKVIKVDIPAVPFWSKQENSRFAKAFFPTEIPDAIQSGKGASLDDSPASLPDAVIPISMDLDDKILSLAKGIQGDPSGLSGHRERMFYLSAVTITTVGYGDISPLTTRARLLVSSEAVAGIIIIGLFLNALSKPKHKGASSASLS